MFSRFWRFSAVAGVATLAAEQTQPVAPPPGLEGIPEIIQGYMNDLVLFRGYEPEVAAHYLRSHGWNPTDAHINIVNTARHYRDIASMHHRDMALMQYLFAAVFCRGTHPDFALEQWSQANGNATPSDAAIAYAQDLDQAYVQKNRVAPALAPVPEKSARSSRTSSLLKKTSPPLVSVDRVRGYLRGDDDSPFKALNLSPGDIDAIVDGRDFGDNPKLGDKLKRKLVAIILAKGVRSKRDLQEANISLKA